MTTVHEYFVICGKNVNCFSYFELINVQNLNNVTEWINANVKNTKIELGAL